MYVDLKSYSIITTLINFSPKYRSATVSNCGKYLILSTKLGKNQLLYFADLEENGPITEKIPLTQIVRNFDAEYDVRVRTILYRIAILDNCFCSILQTPGQS